jgi:putative transposase
MDAQKPTEKELLDRLLDQLVKDYKKPEDILGEQGLLTRLSKAVLGRALGAELTDYLGYEKHDPAGYGSGNVRNGTTEKTLKGKNGEVTIDVPRDRNGTFEPQIVKKHQTRFDGFDEKILSMYARGMTTRDIQGHLEEIYGVEVSPDANLPRHRCGGRRGQDVAEPAAGGRVSDPVSGLAAGENRGCRACPEPRYVCGHGVKLDGDKEVLGLWAGQAEGAKFWLQVVTELKNRGVQDIFIACVDGLKGLPQAVRVLVYAS